MRKFSIVLVALAITTFGSPFASVAFAKGSTEQTVTECTCPDGHHCPKGRAKGFHKHMKDDCETAAGTEA